MSTESNTKAEKAAELAQDDLKASELLNSSNENARAEEDFEDMTFQKLVNKPKITFFQFNKTNKIFDLAGGCKGVMHGL